MFTWIVQCWLNISNGIWLLTVLLLQLVWKFSLGRHWEWFDLTSTKKRVLLNRRHGRIHCNACVWQGERCSVDIQAWNLYMLGLQSDLSASCPPRLCQHIFNAVLKSSLSHFAWRYCHVQPSRRRTPQFMYVAAVYRCVWGASSSIPKSSSLSLHCHTLLNSVSINISKTIFICSS